METQVLSSQTVPPYFSADINIKLSDVVITLRKTRDTIEREQDAQLDIEQATMLFDICTQFKLIPSQIVFIVGNKVANDYGLFSFSGAHND